MLLDWQIQLMMKFKIQFKMISHKFGIFKPYTVIKYYLVNQIKI